MLREVRKQLNNKITNFEDLKCIEHYIYNKTLLVTRIYKECKWLKFDLSSSRSDNKIPKKLRIFENK